MQLTPSDLRDIHDILAQLKAFGLKGYDYLPYLQRPQAERTLDELISRTYIDSGLSALDEDALANLDEEA